MLLRGPRRVPWLGSLLGLLLAGWLTGTGGAAKREKFEPPVPAARIETGSLDYHPLNSFYLMSRSSSSTLDFIDANHLLFTFRATGLLKRLPECPPDDEDQLIRALVLRLPDGKVERSAEWRLHDRAHYLWALGKGRFLVRQRDALFLTDASLELRPFLESQTPLRLVKLSPDARWLLVENDIEKHTAEEHRRLVEEARKEDLEPPAEDVQLSVVRVDDRSLLMQARTLRVADLAMISDGYIETLSARGDHWMLRYRPFQGEPSVIGDVESTCRPSEIALTEDIAVMSTCPERGDDHLFQAISLQGKKLWNYRWDSHYIWPTTAASQSGGKIAFSTLKVGHPVSALDPIDETDLQAQRVEVVDAATGRLELTQYATPVLSAGQNYALSPDGGQFAVLRDNAIEIYNLPPATAEAGAAE